jgi:two-component system, OmpR family, phosphate regulon response regulator PhoB
MTARKHTILVVDDDKDITQSVSSFLAARGYEVLTAPNGAEAEKILDARLPDLVVLDVMMDYDAEGLNLAYKLNTQERTRRIPVVILSGFMKELDEKYEKFQFVMGRDWPAAKFLEKPVQLPELARSIGELIRESEHLHGVIAEAG